MNGAVNRECRRAVLTNALRPIDDVRPVTAGRYLVKGWLDRGAFSCVYGPSNIGKSFFGLDLAMHVSAGRTWFGHRVAQDAGPAVYLCAEGISAFGNRIAALRRVQPTLVQQAARAGMVILPVPLDLCKGEDAKQLVELIEENLDVQPSLILIDTLARSMGAGNENDGADMAAFVASAGLLQAKTGAHVMVVHHVGKNAARGMRGHSSLHAALDTEIELTATSGAIAADVQKQRDMAFIEPVFFHLRSVEIGNDEDGDPVTSAIVEAVNAPLVSRGAIEGNDDRRRGAEDRDSAVLPHLPDDRDFTVKDVVEKLSRAGLINGSTDHSRATLARRKLDKLAAKGKVEKLNAGSYRLVAGGGR